MGLGDFLDSAGGKIEGAAEGAEHAVGEGADWAAHQVGGGLEAVGLYGAAQAVDDAGDWAADHLGAQVGEQQLGQTEDPTKLVRGDLGKINESIGHLNKFATAFGETAEGLRRIDTSHWEGEAADAFRATFHGHPKQWNDAQQACEQAARTLEDYSHVVKAAQDQTRQAVELYKQGQQASQQARDAYNHQVDSYNSQLTSYNAASQSGGQAGQPPQHPGEFHDPGEQTIKEAQQVLARARQQRNDAAARVHSALTAATNLAPAEPRFTDRMLADAADINQGVNVGGEHVLGGIFKGAGGIVKFARSLDPTDPYNLTHPAEFVAGISGTVTGLMHAANHPVELVKGLVGTGWGSDPFEAFGKLIPNVALAAATDGAGAAEDAGASVAERETLGTAEEAGTRSESIAEHNTEPEAHSKPNEDTEATDDPVDLATGRVFLDQTDVELEGVLPLVFTRSHRSDLRVGRWFGANWSSTVDQRIEVDGTGVHFLSADGMLLTYPTPANTPVLPVHGSPLPLSRSDDGEYTITDTGTGRTLRFTPTGTPLLPIAAISDRNGNRIDFTYDDTGVLAEIQHSGGYRIAIDTENGLISALRLLDERGCCRVW